MSGHSTRCTAQADPLMTVTPPSRSAQYCAERRFRWNDKVADVTAVVHPFEAIDQGSTLQRHAPSVGFHLRMGLEALHRHRQRQVDHIAVLPLALEVGIAADFLEGCQGFAVHLQPGLTAPGGQTYIEGKLHFPLRFDRNLDRALPGITGRLPEHDLGAVHGQRCPAADEQIYVYGPVILGINSARQMPMILRNIGGQHGHPCQAQRLRSLPASSGFS